VSSSRYVEIERLSTFRRRYEYICGFPNNPIGCFLLSHSVACECRGVALKMKIHSLIFSLFLGVELRSREQTQFSKCFFALEISLEITGTTNTCSQPNFEPLYQVSMQKLHFDFSKIFRISLF
jgi:hypothetical protein